MSETRALGGLEPGSQTALGLPIGAQIGVKIMENQKHCDFKQANANNAICGGLQTFKVELSSARELNFHIFEILVSRSIFNGFWGQLGSQNPPKIEEKSIKKLFKNC